MAITVTDIDMGTRYTHSNGRALEVVGEQANGEWHFCGDASITGYYTYDADEDITLITDCNDNELEQVTSEQDWSLWAAYMLTL